MADYYPVLSRAVAGLDQNTGEARRAVYERARTAIVKQLRSYDPPLSESEITRERLGLEDAIRRLEAEQRGAGGYGTAPARAADAVEDLRKAAAEVESLGPATMAAQSSAIADKAVLDRPSSNDAPRVEPRFSDGPSQGNATDSSSPRTDDGGAGSNQQPTEAPRRAPAVFAIVAIALLAALGVGAYALRDRLSGSEEQMAGTSSAPPKISDRVAADVEQDGAEPSASEAEPVPGEQATPNAEPGATTASPDTPPATTAPQQEAAPAIAPVAQRAVLYEESPDQQAGTAVPGTAVWKLDEVTNNGAAEPQIRGDIDVPNRNIKIVILIRRNTDQTLPATHTVDMQFTLAPEFANGGVANVPGILFKPGEDAGGTALQGLSVKVMNGFFLIGLSNAPNDKTANVKLMRDSSWIDLPLLYENGRRAVLSIELGTPGQAAFDEALDAWDKITAPGEGAAPTPAP